MVVEAPFVGLSDSLREKLSVPPGARHAHFSRGKIAGYKRPKSIDFIREEDMPRTATGKILHRVLKGSYGR
jgi:acyl-coenzyme A synthetase/AMP-(fatty) acid ligase